MPVEAIGSVLQEVTTSQNSTISQEEFVQLFLTQLTYQDPLEPLDNSEFLAQLAQFSSIEQQRQNGVHLENISEINAVLQATGLIGKSVEIATRSGGVGGTVSSVSFDSSGASLTIEQANGQFINNVRLSQIRVLR
jgi:flagellar basal-body rod modification protein FlgD